MMRTVSATLFGAVIGAVVMAGPLHGLASGPGATSETFRALNLFGDVFDRVRTDYVEGVEDTDLIEGAINGMLNSLDPHSSYLDPETYRDMQVSTRGEYGGLGMQVDEKDGVVLVVAPMDDTPAARAGIEAGDLITHVDSSPIIGMSLDEAIELLRGPVGTDVTITIVRGDEEPFKTTLTREIIELQSVRSRAEDDIGYIRISTFNEKTESGLEEAIADLQKEIGPKLKGYVVDLRLNPGGLLDQAITVTDAFLDGGEVVSTRGRRSGDTERYNARRGDLTNGAPIVVLIDGGSASASEIVAGALQDHDRATVLGTTSFGKGSVQTIIPLGGGTQGAIRLTTSRYYTPSGRSIQARGIVPDIEVLPPGAEEALAKEAEEGADDTETTRGEASLPGHLEALAGEILEDDEDEERAPVRERPVDTEAEDPQLQRALEILHGISATNIAGVEQP